MFLRLVCFILAICVVVVVAQLNPCRTLGIKSNAVCISEYEFKFSPDDPEIYACPPGKVCADFEEICMSNVIPACRYIRSCGVCYPNLKETCVDRRGFTMCTDNSTTLYCPDSAPYCSMLYDDHNEVFLTCTNNNAEIACYMDPTTTSTEPDPETTPNPPNSFVCTELGKFPDESDPTCRRYHYCHVTKDANGMSTIGRQDFECPTKTIYHSLSRKCVSGQNFNCG